MCMYSYHWRRGSGFNPKNQFLIKIGQNQFQSSKIQPPTGLSGYFSDSYIQTYIIDIIIINIRWLNRGRVVHWLNNVTLFGRFFTPPSIVTPSHGITKGQTPSNMMSQSFLPPKFPVLNETCFESI